MKVVYTARHLDHDPTTETVLGVAIPANEVAERGERIRTTLEADGGFQLVAPTEHGREPILAVHDAGLVRFLEEAWPEARRQGLSYSSLAADTYPNRAMFEGLSDDALARLREPNAAGGRAGWWALDTAAPIVQGTYGAARWAVDVALATVDLVLGGDTAAYGLCRPPGHHAARSMFGGYCYFNNAAIAAEAVARQTGEPVAIIDVDFHHGNGTQQIFWRRGDVLYTSIHGHPERQYPYFLGYDDERGEGPGAGANLNVPLPAGTTDAEYLVAVDRCIEAIA
ncbi:MAG: histone deacetylase family protein, partial [Chloroflexi bacterium]|nr:histone deacetylase family protein [Chloroflexota bacterium]